MTITTTQPRISSISMTELVAVSCRVSRVDTCPRPEHPSDPEREGKLLRCPAIGASMWLVIDDVRWLYTSPIVTLETIERDRSVHMTVLTRSSRYHLEFERWVIERATRRATSDSTPAPRLRGSVPQWRTVANWS